MLRTDGSDSVEIRTDTDDVLNCNVQPLSDTEDLEIRYFAEPISSWVPYVATTRAATGTCGTGERCCLFMLSPCPQTCFLAPNHNGFGLEPNAENTQVCDGQPTGRLSL